MKKINWGIIGLGDIAQSFSEGFHNLNNVTKLLVKKKYNITDSDMKEEDHVKREVNEDSPVLINFQLRLRHLPL